MYDTKLGKPLSSSAISIWLALLTIQCKAGWVDEFAVSGPALRLQAAVSEKVFKEARASLVENGYIEHRTRGTKPPVYRVKSLIVDERLIADELESSRTLSAGEGMEPGGGETDIISSDSFLKMKQKVKENLERKAEEINVSQAEGNDEVKE